MYCNFTESSGTQPLLTFSIINAFSLIENNRNIDVKQHSFYQLRIFFPHVTSISS